MDEFEWPFRGAEAVDAGFLTGHQLRRFYVPAYPGVYIPRGIELSDLTMAQRSRAAWLWSRRRGVLAGLSAAEALGAKWIDEDTTPQLIHGNRRPPEGVLVDSGVLLPGEMNRVNGMLTTNAARTAYDLGCRLELVDGVQRLDALFNATDVKIVDVEAVMAAHSGTRGLVRLRETLGFVDGGAESPYESLTRMMLLENGFPAPQTQVRVFDARGNVIARLDMGWPEYRVGVDFDGAHHWTDASQRAKDIDRYALLPDLGWIDIRVNSGILHRRPDEFLDRVGRALESRGCPRTW